MKKILLTLFCLLFFAPEAYTATVNKVAAVVNGQMITAYDIESGALPEIKKNKIDVKNPANKEKLEELYKRVLDNMILEMLLLAEAEKHKVTVSDAEVDAEITRIMQQSRLSKEKFEKQLLSEGLTPDSLHKRIKNTITRQKLMGMMVGRKIVISPEEVKAYYDEHKNELKRSSDPKLALLVYPDTSDANKYAAEIKKDSSKFEQIAKELSIGPNREGGGHVGNIPMDKMDPNLAKLLNSLKEGDVTPVITLNNKKAQFKIIQAGSDGGLMTFEEATPVIEGILREPKLMERFDEYVTQLRKKAIIDIRM